MRVGMRVRGGDTGRVNLVLSCPVLSFYKQSKAKQASGRD